MPSIPPSHADLLDEQFATLATVGPDGLPQLSIVWFLTQDGTVRLSLSTARQKVKNLQRNPSFGFLILDLKNPFRYLELRGTAEIAPDPEYVFANQVGAKYGADLRAYDQPGDSRVVVTLLPTKVNAPNMSS